MASQFDVTHYRLAKGGASDDNEFDDIWRAAVLLQEQAAYLAYLPMKGRRGLDVTGAEGLAPTATGPALFSLCHHAVSTSRLPKQRHWLLAGCTCLDWRPSI
jgi:hypothetical protein